MCVSYTVNPLIITHPLSQNVVSGDSIVFQCLAVAFPLPSYSWSTPSPSTDVVLATNMFIASFSSFGNYTCTASSNGEMVTSDTAVLTGIIKYCEFCVIGISRS